LARAPGVELEAEHLFDRGDRVRPYLVDGDRASLLRARSS